MIIRVVSVADNDRRGSSEWGRVLARAFTKLGHKGDLVRVPEWQRPARRDPRMVSAAVSVLDSADFVVLDELVGRKVAEPQVYVEALRRTRTRWTTYLHGPYYKNAIGIPELLESPGFCGTLFTSTTRERDTLFEAHGVETGCCVFPYLPYYPRKELTGSGREVAFTSVTTKSKGAVPVARLAMYGFDVQLLGWSPQLPGGPSSFHVFKELVEKHGLQVVRTPNALGDPWQVASVVTAGAATFSGGYSALQLEVVLKHAGAHVNLTSRRVCEGHVEYTTLEALDYGVPAIAPRCQLAYWDDCPVFGVSYERPATCDYDELSSQVLHALEMSEYDRMLYAQQAQVYLRERHDPREYARLLLAHAL